MKTMWAYLKSRWFFFMAFLLCAAIFIGVCVLENLPLHRFSYAALIMLAVLCMLCVVDFYSFASHYSRLKRGDLPAASGPLCQMYQRLLSDQSREMRRLELKLAKKAGEQLDYYTLWMHQIKTPIAAMTLLLSNEQKALQSELFKIEQYVEMALSYLRLDAEETDYMFSSVPVDEVIKKALRKYANLFILRKLSLQYEGTSDMALTDPKWLQFIIEQLLSNAIKYTKEGGSIDVSCRDLIFAVSDTGIGIAKEDLPRVFDKGYTGFNGRQHEKSTGIGLHLAKKAADALGHPVQIESEIGQGTQVIIDLNRTDLTKM